MATFDQSLTRIRRFLRDPDGNIWSDAQLRRFWNAAQEEIAFKTGILVRVDTYRVPPLYNYCYMHDWESEYLEGDTYQCLEYWLSGGYIVCYPWEPGSPTASSASPSDEGYRFTIPFEAGVKTCAEPIPNLLHSRFVSARIVMYDEEEITPLSMREVQAEDRYYRTRQGEATNYYRPDDYSNQLVIYPRPTVVFDDLAVGDIFSDTGGIVTWLSDSIDYSDYGLVTEQIETENNLLVVYEYLPYDLSEDPERWGDDLDIPVWLTKYVEYSVLGRAYAADTDGFIPSLRDYWEFRKEAGINVLKVFMRKKLADRTFTMGGGKTRRHPRRPSLPSTYPRQYP